MMACSRDIYSRSMKLSAIGRLHQKFRYDGVLAAHDLRLTDRDSDFWPMIASRRWRQLSHPRLAVPLKKSGPVICPDVVIGQNQHLGSQITGRGMRWTRKMKDQTACCCSLESVGGHDYPVGDWIIHAFTELDEDKFFIKSDWFICSSRAG